MNPFICEICGRPAEVREVCAGPRLVRQHYYCREHAPRMARLASPMAMSPEQAREVERVLGGRLGGLTDGW